MPKVFFGIEIAPEIKQRLLKVRAPVMGAHWQNSDQLHLTLAFLGEVPAAKVTELCQIASSVSEARFELEVRRLGCFGSPDQPRILWAGVSPELPVAALHRQLADKLGKAGCAIEHHNFRPHITLSRFGRPAGSVRDFIQAGSGAVFGCMIVREFVLYESTQGPTGSVYTVLSRFSLR
ncbi:RNA 2',3'-cyclic phosphodiesterase [Marinobacter sp.]|uniref:RNA 2',3'-cyclic phosphodiesterase n=1 Tax=Marinobacter sp. TaxID=50741 RepID=UPI00356695AA